MLLHVSESCKKSLSPSEESVIRYINANEHRICDLSITQIAEESFTSAATVSRAIRKCGIQGIAQLRYLVHSERKDQQESFLVNDILKKSYTECTNTIANIRIDSILEITSLIRSASKIYIIAMGLTALVAQEFQTELQLLRFNTCLLTDSELIKRMKFIIGPSDLLVIFTVKNSTPDLVTAATIAKKQSAKVVTCCCIRDTALDDLSDVIIYGESQSVMPDSQFGLRSRLPLNIISRTIIEYFNL